MHSSQSWETPLLPETGDLYGMLLYPSQGMEMIPTPREQESALLSEKILTLSLVWNMTC